MFMTFEKIEPDLRHPALKAAEMIKSLHLETIKLIDEGQVFLKDGVDISADMRAQCIEQISKCDVLMEYARRADPTAWKPEGFLIESAEQVVNQKREELDAALVKANTIPAEDALPEIGNYDQTDS